MHSFTNKLIHESSPYLLQHAHNPVNWHPWGEEALAIAKKENKPMLVSIGYSSCHWCHVMERESFEDPAIAKIMNENFVNIKIDREERPDLDHIYMDAVQAMTGSGGWPLNVFLTPDQKPFYGGTYFPPRRAFNRPAWQEILLGISQAFRERRNEIEAQSENIIEHILQSNSFGLSEPGEKDVFTKGKMDEAFENIMKSADREWGGFGSAPKFPQTFSIQFLLRYYHVTNPQLSETAKAPSTFGRHRLAEGDAGEGLSEGVLADLSKGEVALQQALLSIDKMIDGGIYDQVGGGFARYSTDREWLVPHFEKMLYDNALIIAVTCEAYQLTKKDRYRQVIEETIQFIQREMMHPAGGFFSALDADSEGEEGKFYVWEYREVIQILKEDAEIFCSFFEITVKGNFENKNILWRKTSEEAFSEEKKISKETLRKIIHKGKEKLLLERGKRIRPLLDDKVLLGWNALMNIALVKAFAATGIEEYRQLAKDNMQFLLKSFTTGSSSEFYHTWKNGLAKHPAFLDDYAYLIQALILLQEVTGDIDYLIRANEITEFVIENFSEEESMSTEETVSQTGFFFYTNKSQHDIIVRKKEIYDGAQPSGNAVMADNLYRLSLYLDKPAWKERAHKILSILGKVVTRYPTSFGVWAGLLLEMVNGTDEIVIVGTNAYLLQKEILENYIPHKILMCSERQSSQFPLLSDRKEENPALIYLCRNYSCLKPVTSVKDLLTLRMPL